MLSMYFINRINTITDDGCCKKAICSNFEDIRV